MCISNYLCLWACFIRGINCLIRVQFRRDRYLDIYTVHCAYIYIFINACLPLLGLPMVKEEKNDAIKLFMFLKRQSNKTSVVDPTYMTLEIYIIA